MLPLIAETFQVTVPQAGWTVTIFALGIALCGPVTPMLFSRFDRKLVIKLGNAGGVRMKYDGRELLQPGKMGQVKTLVFPQAAVELSGSTD